MHTHISMYVLMYYSYTRTHIGICILMFYVLLSHTHRYMRTYVTLTHTYRLSTKLPWLLPSLNGAKTVKHEMRLPERMSG